MIRVINPATEKVVASLEGATVEDFAAAVTAASGAFDRGPWRHLSVHERGEYVHALAAALAERRDAILETVIAETGCPRPLSALAQVDAPIADLSEYVRLA